MNLSQLRKDGILIAHLPAALCPRLSTDLVLANLSEKHEIRGSKVYEFVVWRLGADGNCFSGEYFVGEDAMVQLTRATKKMLERAGIPEVINE